MDSIICFLIFTSTLGCDLTWQEGLTINFTKAIHSAPSTLFTLQLCLYFFLLLIITKFKSSLDTYTQLSINILLGKPVQLFVIKYLIHQSQYSNSLHLGMYTSSRRLAEV